MLQDLQLKVNNLQKKESSYRCWGEKLLLRIQNGQVDTMHMDVELINLFVEEGVWNIAWLKKSFNQYLIMLTFVT